MSLQRIRRLVRHLRSRDYAAPLRELTFATVGREIYFQHPDGSWEGDRDPIRSSSNRRSAWIRCGPGSHGPRGDLRKRLAGSSSAAAVNAIGHHVWRSGRQTTHPVTHRRRGLRIGPGVPPASAARSKQVAGSGRTCGCVTPSSSSGRPSTPTGQCPTFSVLTMPHLSANAWSPSLCRRRAFTMTTAGCGCSRTGAGPCSSQPASFGHAQPGRGRRRSITHL